MNPRIRSFSIRSAHGYTTHRVSTDLCRQPQHQRLDGESNNDLVVQTTTSCYKHPNLFLWSAHLETYYVRGERHGFMQKETDDAALASSEKVPSFQPAYHCLSVVWPAMAHSPRETWGGSLTMCVGEMHICGLPDWLC